MDRRPTQSDVARAAGVHRATVSLVFKNHPSIPEQTKSKVRMCAEKLGYSPDPMLSALAAYRGRLRPRAFEGTLAWLTNDDGTESWRGVAGFRDLYEGASARAKIHGFHIEGFDLKRSAPSPERLASMFRFRNIHGILLPPQLEPNTEIEFPWQEFCAVTFGYSLVKPQLHTVTATQFRSMVQTMRQLKRLGYKRIGFFFTANHDEKTDHNYLAGYLVERYGCGKSATIPPLFLSEAYPEKFKKWYEKYRPEAIVTGNRDTLDFLQSLRIRVPLDLGVASPLVPQRNSKLAGVYEDSFHIGEVATDFLVAMIHRGERGVPVRSQRVHIEGEWNPGSTLRQMADAVAPDSTEQYAEIA